MRQFLTGIIFGAFLVAVMVTVRLALGHDLERLPIAFALPLILIGYLASGRAAATTTFLLCGLLTYQIMYDEQDLVSVMVGYIVSGGVIVLACELNIRAERLRSEVLERQANDSDTIAQEFQHRLKNILTVIQSLIFQSTSIDPASRKDLIDRVHALLDAQQVFRTGHAALRDLIEVAMKPFEHENIAISGEDCTVAENQAAWLSLALHELATNATKYGSLSVDDGRVNITISHAPQGVSLLWRESGGPPVMKPQTQGFGSKLLSKANASIDYTPEGLCCVIPKIACVED